MNADVSLRFHMNTLLNRFNIKSSDPTDVTLNFNHPVKELVWSSVTTADTGARTALTGTDGLLKLNGHDFAQRPTSLFHSNTGMAAP